MRHDHRYLRAGALALATLLLSGSLGCSGDEDKGDDTGNPTGWQKVHKGLPGALLSVWGTSAEDVWVVGADARDGTGPLVLHYDGAAWERVETGRTQGNLWWVYGFEGGPIYMGGDGGVILRYDGSDFTVMETPGTPTVFGIWGSSANDLWAVGGESATSGGFAWRNQGGDTWTPEPTLPTTTASAAVWKVYGTGPNDAWLVGAQGKSFHWDGQGLTEEETGIGVSLFTVHAAGGRYAAVGGTGSGFIVENEGSGWTNVTPADAAFGGFSGVCLGPSGTGYAVGLQGVVFSRTEAGWVEEDLGIAVTENLHGVWIDPSGEVWAVGGQTASPPFTNGVLIHMGEPITSEGI